MSKRRFFAGIFALLLSSPLLAGTELKLPVPEVETLPNGLELVWFPSDRLPVVDLEMVFRSGTKDDPVGKSGTAELLSAVLDRGAGGLTANQIARKVESLGASRFTSADADFFKTGMHGLTPDADVLLDLLAKIVVHPEFPEAEISKEKNRMIEGWRRIADYGDSLVELAYRRSLAQGTVYARGDFLSVREFSHVTRADLTKFYQKHFTPKNATLMIVGRVDRKKFRARIESLFGSWKGEAPRRNGKEDRKTFRTALRGAKPGEVLLIDRPSLTQAQVRIGFRAPLVDDSRHYPLIVANALLGEYFHSRLNTLIRDKLGLTYGIESSFNYNRDLATFTVASATRNETVGQLITKTLGVLDGLKRGPVPTEEVDLAKTYLIGGFPLSTATLEGVANRWLTCHLFDLSPDRLNEFVPQVSAVTPAEVTSAVSKSFDLKNLAMVVAGDAKTIEKSLRAAGFAVRRISAQDLLSIEHRPSK